MASKADNKSDDSCNEMLLVAVRENDAEAVQRLLQNPNLDVNYDIGGGKTILFESLRYTTNESIFLSLLNAGFDINFRTKETTFLSLLNAGAGFFLTEENTFPMSTPLHHAVMHSPISFAHELIKRGADINAVDSFEATPLYDAVSYQNLDAVCMLLYYGADTNVGSSWNWNNNTVVRWETPLLESIRVGGYCEITRILYNYYDDFSTPSILYHAICYCKGPIAIDMLKTGTCCNENVESLLMETIFHGTAEIFQLICSTYKEEIREENYINSSFLLAYLTKCSFCNSDWLECLH